MSDLSLSMVEQSGIPAAYGDSKLGYAGLGEVFAILQALGRLPEDWDGEGANPIHPGTIENAAYLIAHTADLLPIPDIEPVSNGTVSFEWSVGQGVAYMEIGRTRFSIFVEVAGTGLFRDDGLAESLSSSDARLLFARIASSMTDGGITPYVECVGRNFCSCSYVFGEKESENP